MALEAFFAWKNPNTRNIASKIEDTFALAPQIARLDRLTCLSSRRECHLYDFGLHYLF